MLYFSLLQPEWNTSKIFPIAPNSTADSAPDLILTLAFSDGNSAAQDLGRVQLPMGYLKVIDATAPASISLPLSLSVAQDVHVHNSSHALTTYVVVS
jgi:hypothetical protein